MSASAVSAGNDPFLQQNMTQCRKSFINQSNVGYFNKTKITWKVIIICYFQKKMWTWFLGGPVFGYIGS